MHSLIARMRLQIGSGKSESKVGLKAMLERTFMTMKTLNLSLVFCPGT